MPKTHYFPEDQVHYVWDNELAPALTVEPGDTVVYHTREVSDGQATPDSKADVLSGLDWERLYPLAGPVAMAGAEPGDILTVEVLDIRTQGWGWSAVLPGFGLLSEDFPDAYLKIFDLINGDYTLQGRHRHPHRALLRDDGRESHRPREARYHAARTVRRQYGYPPHH